MCRAPGRGCVPSGEVVRGRYDKLGGSGGECRRETVHRDATGRPRRLHRCSGGADDIPAHAAPVASGHEPSPVAACFQPGARRRAHPIRAGGDSHDGSTPVEHRGEDGDTLGRVGVGHIEHDAGTQSDVGRAATVPTIHGSRPHRSSHVRGVRARSTAPCPCGCPHRQHGPPVRRIPEGIDDHDVTTWR